MARSSNPATPRRRKPAANDPASAPAPAEAPQDAPASVPAPAANPAAGVTADRLAEANKDAHSGVEDAQTVLKLAPKVASGLESLSRALKDARAIREQLAILLMQVRLCFTFNGNPDYFGEGNAYRDGFATVIVDQVAAATGIPTRQVRLDLDSVRSNLLNAEGRKDAAIVEHLHAKGEVSKEAYAEWTQALAKVDGKPRKLAKEDVPKGVRPKLAAVYRKADQKVPDAYLTPSEAEARKVEDAAKGSGSGKGAGPDNPSVLISELTTELITAGKEHPYLLADALWRASTALSDDLIGAPGAAGRTDIPNRDTIYTALTQAAMLNVLTVGVVRDGRPKDDQLASTRYVERAEAPDLLATMSALLKGTADAPKEEAPKEDAGKA